MPRSSARRRKRRQESRETTVPKDAANDALSNNINGSSSRHTTLEFWKRVVKAAIAFFLAIGVLSFFFRRRLYDVDENALTPPTSSSTTKSMEGPDYKVLQVLPHDTSAFTQGLSYWKGNLYESTGHYGQSQIRRLNIQTGQVTRSVDVDRRYFGEGLAHFTNKDGEDCLIQVTWQEKTGFIYRLNDLQLLQTFNYTTSTREGWGITFDATNKEFIVSDGSHNLHFWDYDTLKEKRRVEVKFGKYNQEGQVVMHKIPYLNELEWDSHDGTILSNIWFSNTIIRINPTSGLVERGYNFDNLYTDRKETEDCFNGIALSDKHGELYVTGKWWPNLYRIRLVER